MKANFAMAPRGCTPTATSILLLFSFFSFLSLAAAASTTWTLTSDTTINILGVVAKTASDDFFNQGNVIDFSLSSATASAASAPVLTVTRGVTLTFTSQTSVLSSHPFYITDNAAGGGSGSTFMGPISTNGGSASWHADPTGNGTATFYYACDIHQYMGNRIVVVPAVQAASSTAPAMLATGTSSGSSGGSSGSSSGTMSSSSTARGSPFSNSATETRPILFTTLLASILTVALAGTFHRL